MKRNVYLVDSDVHASMRESLEEIVGLTDTPVGASAFVTQRRDIDAETVAAAGKTLKAVFVLEPSAANVAPTSAPIHRLENAALTGVAEHAVLLMLALAKRLPWVLERTRGRTWSEDAGEPTLTNQKEYGYNWVGLQQFGMLAHRTVGLVGLGTIAKATARILRGFSANIIYYKPAPLARDDESALGVRHRPLDALLGESDFVSLHHRFFDGEDGNDREFGEAQFARMKETAFFINTARGRMVDEDALYRAIDSGEIAGAGLDVFRYEPLPDDHPFFDLPSERMILTPHLAGVPMREAADTMSVQIQKLLES